MNDLLTFRNPEFGEIRTVEIDGAPWLVGKDVARTLGYTNPQKAIRDHVDEEDRGVNESFTVNGTAPILINESGLYSLILSSKLPEAKRFKRWVTSEILPAIRKSGNYSPELQRTIEALEERVKRLEEGKPHPKKKKPKTMEMTRFTVCLTQHDMAMLTAVSEKLCTNKSMAIRCGINRVARDLGVYIKPW